MLSWILQISIISLVLIILVHYLFTFFKTNLTIPKIKDLVNKPQEQYEMLFNTIKNTNQLNTNQLNTNQLNSNDDSTTESSKLQGNTEMKNELKNYLKELSSSKMGSSSGLNGKMNTDTGGILTSDNLMSSNMGSNNYSVF